jgi:hypothetical protein
LHHTKQSYDPLTLHEVLCKPAVEHKFYSGNHFCRIQDLQNGRCTNYHGRALACRLHGHDAVRLFESPDMEFCAKNPGNNKALTKESLRTMLEKLFALQQEYDNCYTEPYYILSLNLDAWLDFLFVPTITANRPELLQLKEWMDSLLNFPTPPGYRPHTTLAGKLNAVDRLFKLIETGNATAIKECLESLLYDFPSVGSYYLNEAQKMLAVVP